MKKSLALTLMAGILSFTQAGFAESLCNTNGAGSEMAEVMPFLMILTVTSAPTGTSMLFCQAHREVALNLKESALKYQMTGTADAILLEGLEVAQKTNPELSADAVIEKLINLKMEQ